MSAPYGAAFLRLRSQGGPPAPPPPPQPQAPTAAVTAAVSSSGGGGGGGGSSFYDSFMESVGTRAARSTSTGTPTRARGRGRASASSGSGTGRGRGGRRAASSSTSRRKTSSSSDSVDKASIAALGATIRKALRRGADPESLYKWRCVAPSRRGRGRGRRGGGGPQRTLFVLKGGQWESYTGTSAHNLWKAIREDGGATTSASGPAPTRHRASSVTAAATAAIPRRVPPPVQHSSSEEDDDMWEHWSDFGENEDDEEDEERDEEEQEEEVRWPPTSSPYPSTPSQLLAYTTGTFNTMSRPTARGRNVVASTTTSQRAVVAPKGVPSATALAPEVVRSSSKAPKRARSFSSIEDTDADSAEDEADAFLGLQKTSSTTAPSKPPIVATKAAEVVLLDDDDDDVERKVPINHSHNTQQKNDATGSAKVKREVKREQDDCQTSFRTISAPHRATSSTVPKVFAKTEPSTADEEEQMLRLALQMSQATHAVEHGRGIQGTNQHSGHPHSIPLSQPLGQNSSDFVQVPGFGGHCRGETGQVPTPPAPAPRMKSAAVLSSAAQRSVFPSHPSISQSQQPQQLPPPRPQSNWGPLGTRHHITTAADALVQGAPLLDDDTSLATLFGLPGARQTEDSIGPFPRSAASHHPSVYGDANRYAGGDDDIPAGFLEDDDIGGDDVLGGYTTTR